MTADFFARNGVAMRLKNWCKINRTTLAAVGRACGDYSPQNMWKYATGNTAAPVALIVAVEEHTKGDVTAKDWLFSAPRQASNGKRDVVTSRENRGPEASDVP